MTAATPASAPIAIRRARSADLLAVYRLERTCFSSPWPYQAFLSHLDAEAFLLATVNGDLAGYLVASVSPRFGGKVGHIKDLAVAPTYRRRGIARRLMQTGLARLSGEGAVRAVLEVRETNEPAQALYRDLGFREDRIEPGYYEDGADAVIMVRRLS